jgi:putative hydrolase of the HAD superfamily
MADSSAAGFKVAFFDYGGVFIDSPFPAFMSKAESMGVDPDALIELTFGPLGRDSQHPWHRLERGELSMFDVRDEVLVLCRGAGIEVDPFVLLAKTMSQQASGHPLVLESARELRRRGLKVGLVTNNAAEIRDRWRAVLPLDELFDDVVDSSEVGVRKPDPAIYALALDRMGGIPAEAAIFLDDLEENLATARDLGMHGIRVDPDPTLAMQELDDLTATG